MIPLSIDAIVPAPCQVPGAQHQAVLEAPPGTGKTTRVSLALLGEPQLAGQRILMLEPRRLAARAAAEQLTTELGEKVGETVGYRIRLENRVDLKTRIEVVTENIFTRRLQDNPALDSVSLAIFDEFHERSLDADLTLALTLNGRELLRDEPPLKVLVISATLEGEHLMALFGEAPMVRSEGHMFPVDIHWRRAAQPGGFIEPRMQQAVLQTLTEGSGSVLVFLPGQAEIRRVHEGLRRAPGGHPEVLLYPLHGELDLAAQRAAIEPTSRGTRKVVLTTNIVKTSLTIDSIRMVVDAGPAQVPRFDPGSGMTCPGIQHIPRASVTQHVGRARRLEPGICYRLWSKSRHGQLSAYGTAEILQTDLAGLALQLARWGMVPEKLAWLDAPPATAYAQAYELLGRLGALNASGALSAHGRTMAELPTHPCIAHLLLRGQTLDLDELACDAAALPGKHDIQRGGGAGLHNRLALLADEARLGASHGTMQHVRQLARQFRGYLRGITSKAVVDPGHPHWLGCLLVFAYPGRIAHQRRAGGDDYRPANGRVAQLDEPDNLMRQPQLVIVDLGSRQDQHEERIYLAVELDPRLFDAVLAEQVSQCDELQWDEHEGVLRAERQRRVGGLVLSSKALPDLDEAARNQALLGLVRCKSLELLPQALELRQWQARIGLLHRLGLENKGKSEWPNVGDAALPERLEGWLPAYLGKVTRLAHFVNLDLASILVELLPWLLPQRLDEWAPKTLEVPSGSRVRLDYSKTPPILAIHLQELFDLGDAPRITQGRLAVKLHPLSPTHCPVQVAQDLANFWRSTYAEVKKGLKGRYSKHYWPNGPLVAGTTARAKPREQPTALRTPGSDRRRGSAGNSGVGRRWSQSGCPESGH